MIRKKQIKIIKIRIKNNIKIKLKKNIQNKINITIKNLRIKFDIISK